MPTRDRCKNRDSFVSFFLFKWSTALSILDEEVHVLYYTPTLSSDTTPSPPSFFPSLNFHLHISLSSVDVCNGLWVYTWITSYKHRPVALNNQHRYPQLMFSLSEQFQPYSVGKLTGKPCIELSAKCVCVRVCHLATESSVKLWTHIHSHTHKPPHTQCQSQLVTVN